MKRFTLLAAACAAIAGLAAACTPPPAAPEPPVTIGGPGRYTFDVTYDGAPNFVGSNDAESDLFLDGSVYKGVVLSVDCADPGLCPQGYFELTLAGNDISQLYTRDVAAAAGEGFELVTNDVDATSVPANPLCGGDAGVDIDFSGGYTVDGVPEPLFAATATVTICDEAAADFFA